MIPYLENLTKLLRLISHRDEISKISGLGQKYVLGHVFFFRKFFEFLTSGSNSPLFDSIMASNGGILFAKILEKYILKAGTFFANFNNNKTGYRFGPAFRMYLFLKNFLFLM